MSKKDNRVQELLDQALDLPADEQAELAQALIETHAEAYGVGGLDDDLHAAFDTPRA